MAAPKPTKSTELSELAGPQGTGARDPDATAAALDALRVRYEELVVVAEERRVQLEELRRNQEATRIERERADALFKYAPDAHVITDLVGVVVRANIMAENLFGREARMLVGEPLSSCFGQKEHAVFDAQMAAGRTGVCVERTVHALGASDRDTAASVIVSRIGTTDELVWRFRLVVPAGPLVTASPRTDAPADRLRVLLLGHEPDGLGPLGDVAEELGAEIAEVDSIDAAVERLQTFRADIVVADVFLQTEEGLDIISVLRRRNHRPMPVAIAVTAPRGPMDSRRALAVGFHAFLMKPVTKHAARSALHEAARVRAKRKNKRRPV